MQQQLRYTHIVDEADSVPYRYCAGTTPPTSPEGKILEADVVAKARFSLNLGAVHYAEHLYICFRWFNTRHKETAGGWSSIVETLILYYQITTNNQTPKAVRFQTGRTLYQSAFTKGLSVIDCYCE